LEGSVFAEVFWSIGVRVQRDVASLCFSEVVDINAKTGDANACNRFFFENIAPQKTLLRVER